MPASAGRTARRNSSTVSSPISTMSDTSHGLFSSNHRWPASLHGASVVPSNSSSSDITILSVSVQSGDRRGVRDRGPSTKFGQLSASKL